MFNFWNLSMIKFLKSLFSKDFKIDGHLVTCTTHKDEKDRVYQFHTCCVNGFKFVFESRISFLNMATASKFATADIYVGDTRITHRTYHFPDFESPLSTIRMAVKEFISRYEKINPQHIEKMKPLFVKEIIPHYTAYELSTKLLRDNITVCSLTMDLQSSRGKEEPVHVLSYIAYNNHLFMKAEPFFIVANNYVDTHIQKNKAGIKLLAAIEKSLFHKHWDLEKCGKTNFELIRKSRDLTVPYYSINEELTLLYTCFSGLSVNGHKTQINIFLELSLINKTVNFYVITTINKHVIQETFSALPFKLIDVSLDLEYYADHIMSTFIRLSNKYAPNKEILKSLDLESIDRPLSDDELLLIDMMAI